ncbi:MAG: hypothetical protein ACR2GY_12750 [Phycisphaerales bacterium]
MHASRRLALLAALSAPLLMCAPHAVADDFTYQGELRLSGDVVNDNCDVRFSLWDAASAGTQIGSNITLTNQAVVDGKITANLDFGNGTLNGSPRWLRIEVRCPAGSGSYVALTPRQPLTPAPYAHFALNANVPFVYAGVNGVFAGTGNVLIGPAFLASKFSVVSDDQVAGIFSRNHSSTNTIRNAFEISGQTTGTAANGLGTSMSIRNEAANGAHAESARITSVWTDIANSKTDLIFSNRTGGGGVQEVMRFDGDGDIGIGTTNPIAKLHVAGTGVLSRFSAGASSTAIIAEAFGTNAGGMSIYTISAGTPALRVWNDDPNGYSIHVIENSFFDGTAIWDNDTQPMIAMFDAGSNNADRMVLSHSPAFPTWGLEYRDNGDVFVFRNSSADSTTIPLAGTDANLTSVGYQMWGTQTSINVIVDNNEIMARNNGAASTLSINHDGGNVNIGQNSGGTTRLLVPVIQITGGSDFSEMFNVQSELEVIPGMVMVIDPQNPGHLMPCTDAYDFKVAGVVSGAGGVNPGMMMGQADTLADGDHPIALSGRVYVLVDASTGAVTPGDMLTTSSTAGHAMKASDRDRSHGAVIGKAMTALEQGEVGLVLVLVNLQ